MSELLPRIKEILEWKALGPAAFADEIGVARPVISHVVSARNKASLEVVQKIMNRFPEVSPAWLLLGEGEMLSKLGDGPAPSSLGISLPEPPLLREEKADQVEKIQTEKETPLPVKARKATAEKELVKVILLYSDGSFAEYHPGK